MVAIAKPTFLVSFSPYSHQFSLDGSGLPNGDVLSKNGTKPEIFSSLVEVEFEKVEIENSIIVANSNNFVTFLIVFYFIRLF